MKNCFLYILPLLLAVVPASCVYDYPAADAPADDDTRVWLTFTLAVDQANGTAPTRTTWEDNYDPESGTTWENHIDPDDVQVLIYSTDGNQCIAQVENLACIQAEGGYTYHGELTASAGQLQAGEPYKIMVLANCGGINNTNDIPNLTFTEGSTGYIPMWGVTTATLDLTPGLSQDLGQIDLLRALAKIEVVLGDAPKTEYTITGITLNRRNTTGYCLPDGWSTVDKTTDLERESNTPASFRPYSSLASSAGNFAVADNQLSAAYYLPEYAKSDANPAQLTITLAKDGKTKDYTLDLKDYTTGAYYDLVRNHIYRYTVTGVQDGELAVSYRVLPWEKVTSGIGWEEGGCQLIAEGGEETDLSSGDADAVYCILCKPAYKGGVDDNDELKEGSAGARFTFHLQKPEGTVWTAHLSNEEDFYFSTTPDDGTHMAVTGIAREEPYTIQINARNAWTKGTSFDQLTPWGQEQEERRNVPSTYFYITISTDGIHEEELVINPIHDAEVGGYKNPLYKENRRFAGTDTRIWIRQLRAVKGMNFEELARNVDPTDNRFDWWRVNPYWK